MAIFSLNINPSTYCGRLLIVNNKVRAPLHTFPSHERPLQNRGVCLSARPGAPGERRPGGTACMTDRAAKRVYTPAPDQGSRRAGYDVISHHALRFLSQGSIVVLLSIYDGSRLKFDKSAIPDPFLIHGRCPACANLTADWKRRRRSRHEKHPTPFSKPQTAPQRRASTYAFWPKEFYKSSFPSNRMIRC